MHRPSCRRRARANPGTPPAVLEVAVTVGPTAAPRAEWGPATGPAARRDAWLRLRTADGVADLHAALGMPWRLFPSDLSVVVLDRWRDEWTRLDGSFNEASGRLAWNGADNGRIALGGVASRVAEDWAVREPRFRLNRALGPRTLERALDRYGAVLDWLFEQMAARLRPGSYAVADPPAIYTPDPPAPGPAARPRRNPARPPQVRGAARGRRGLTADGFEQQTRAGLRSDEALVAWVDPASARPWPERPDGGTLLADGFLLWRGVDRFVFYRNEFVRGPRDRRWYDARQDLLLAALLPPGANPAAALDARALRSLTLREFEILRRMLAAADALAAARAAHRAAVAPARRGRRA